MTKLIHPLTFHAGVAPRISLVGAGPGDPDLITRKGLRALRTADVVLYDALVAPELLEEVPVGATKIYVGKRAGQHSMKQEEINELLVESALRCGHAVRLKGGDPFVFGRGQEELLYAQERGIPTTLVPGISSCIAVPELQGVAPTRRGYSQSFWVMTGRGKDGELPEDLTLAAQSQATAIILMGLRRIHRIMDVYAEAGRRELPVMVIQNGSLPNERCWLGTVADIADRVAAEQDAGPGLIVIGEVVRLHPTFARAKALENVQ